MFDEQLFEQHAGTCALFADGEPERGEVGEAIVEREAHRLIDGCDLPIPCVLVALRACHEVGHSAAGAQVVVNDGGRVGRGCLEARGTSAAAR